MDNITQRYLMLSVDVQPDGFNVQAWMSPERPHPIDLLSYPNTYTYMGEACTWFIYSATEITPKIINMAGEQADRICIANKKINDKRKVHGRK